MTTRRLKMTMEEIVKCFCGAESAKKALEKDLACVVKRTPMAVKWVAKDPEGRPQAKQEMI